MGGPMCQTNMYTLKYMYTLTDVSVGCIVAMLIFVDISYNN